MDANNKMGWRKYVWGKDVRIVAFPALCAGATIAFVIVVQMTYSVEEHPRFHLQDAALSLNTDTLETQNWRQTPGDVTDHAQNAGKLHLAVTEKGVLKWLLAQTSDAEHTRVNQTQLLNRKRGDSVNGSQPLNAVEKTGDLKHGPVLQQRDLHLDIDVVSELHLEKYIEGTPSPRDTALPFSSGFDFEENNRTLLGTVQREPTKDGATVENTLNIYYKFLFPKPKSAPQHSKIIVPKIVHVIRFNRVENCTFRFHQFICLLSIHKFIKPHKIFFWYDNLPCGRWWEEVQMRVSNIAMMQIEPPSSIFGRQIHVLEHKTDVLRIMLVLRYGGIYMDLDVIALKSWDPLLYYDTSLGAENPNLFGSGVIVSVKGAKFMRLWYDSYRAFSDNLWNFNSGRVPTLIANRYPELLHIEWDTLHRPSWTELDYLYTPGKLWDWSVNYGVHLWYRFHKVEHNPDDIRVLNTTMGELFRYVYYGTADFVF